MTDQLSNLREASFRGISFPCALIAEQIQHDQAQHKRADRDGAYVENTGRGPASYTVTIPFLVGLLRAPQETWADLFPARYNAFRSAWADRSTGVLVHPLYGEVRVKPSTWSASLDPDSRTGIVVTVGFVETNDDEADTATIKGSEYGSAKSAAIALDQKLFTLKPPPPVFDTTDPEQSFEQIVDKVLFYSNPSNLYVQGGLQKINSAIRKAQKVQTLLDRGVSVATTNPLTQVTSTTPLNAGIASIRSDAQNLTNSLIQIRSKVVNTGNRTVKVYTMSQPQTLLSLSLVVGNTTTQLLTLNPYLERKGPLLAPQKVRYFG